MNQERIMSILLAPHVSEKASIAAEKGEFVFKVAINATKLEIKKAVEQMFDVKVERVTTAVAKGKTKRTGQVSGRRSDWKKAYVSLQEGQDIDFVGAE
ncbi:MAG: 50S ribosomal protein L23 [Kangiellaceae bacterium]|jgi:large subunit ribosomal protein L23|nr:50S ribosomal protein L23 [Kangiellaceae bacterium]MCW8999734.1 50S ribosomal protein L23 [Kangiellaceae bacterium]